MTNFKILFQEGKSEFVSHTYIQALTKGLARTQFKEDFSEDCIILNIEECP